MGVRKKMDEQGTLNSTIYEYFNIENCATDFAAAFQLVELVEQTLLEGVCDRLFQLRNSRECQDGVETETWTAVFYGIRRQKANRPEVAICKAAITLKERDDYLNTQFPRRVKTDVS